MHDAAVRAHVDPDRLAFLHAVRVARRKLPLYGTIYSSLRTKKHIAESFLRKSSKNVCLRGTPAKMHEASNEK